MEVSLPENTLVWAKISGYPWWPGYIRSSQSNQSYEIEYFGDFTRNSLKRSKIKLFDEIKSIIGKTNAKLTQAFRSAKKVHTGESTIANELQKFQFEQIKKSQKHKIPFSEKTKPESTNDDLSKMSPLDLLTLDPSLLKPQTCDKTIDTQTTLSRIKKIRKTCLKKTFGFQTADFQPDPNGSPCKINSPQPEFSNDIDPHFKLESSPLHSPCTVRHLSLNESDQRHCEVLELERVLKDILKNTNRRHFESALVSEQLNSWVAKFLNSRRQVQQMHNLKIGPLLIKVKQQLYSLSTRDFNVYPLYEDMLVLVETVKSVMCQEFFQCEFDFDRLLLDDCSHPTQATTTTIDTSMQLKLPVSDSREPSLISHESSVELDSSKVKDRALVDSISVSSIDPQVVFRVCRFLAKSFHKLLKPAFFNKENIEIIVTQLENKIRVQSQSVHCYKRLICRICKILPLLLKTAAFEAKRDGDWHFDGFLAHLLGSQLIFQKNTTC